MTKKKTEWKDSGLYAENPPHDRRVERLINAVNNTRSAGEMLALREELLAILIELTGIQPRDNQSITDGE